MKTIASMLLIVLSIVMYGQENNNPKEILTISFKVAGNCEQCKERIENAADIKGVKLAVWDSKTQLIKVVYKTDKVTESEIKAAILKTGHDVEDSKAPNDAYNKLPDCCKYRERKHGN